MMFWLQTLGLWSWFLAGLLLFGLELVIPGVFLIWFGCSAVMTALVCALLAPLLPAFASWQFQLGLFSLLSLSFVLLGYHLARSREQQSDNPFLNRRMDEMAGQIATLEEAIKDGHGRIRLGDTLWRVKGADMPAGSSVRLVCFDNGVFVVEEIKD